MVNVTVRPTSAADALPLRVIAAPASAASIYPSTAIALNSSVGAVKSTVILEVIGAVLPAASLAVTVMTFGLAASVSACKSADGILTVHVPLLVTVAV